MNTNLPRDRWFRNIVLMLVGGSLLLAIIDPNVRPLFIEAAKACLTLYIGRSLPELKA
jgi:hypothetical protein